MAKFYGSAVKTGKLGGSVFAIRFGEVIERQYQPVVNNPNTNAQVAARARLKLMSQLAAVMAPVIAIPRVGAVSSRNLFVKHNYQKSSYANDSASVQLASIQLTRGIISLPAITATRGTGTIEVTLNSSSKEYSRVVYCCFAKQSDDTLRFYSSTVIEGTGDLSSYSGSLPAPTASVVVYAYGVRDNTSAARVLFGELSVPTAESVAKVIVTRALTDADITLTDTQGVEVPRAQ